MTALTPLEHSQLHASVEDFERLYGKTEAEMVKATLLEAIRLGVLVGETKFGERAVMPYLVALDTMPKVAFAPIFIAWLGFDIQSKVALATFIATFPIVVGTAAGLHAADENARMLFKTMGATRLQTLFKMKIPTGMPHFFTGLKIASVGVMAGAITGEFLGGGKGIGEDIALALDPSFEHGVLALTDGLTVDGSAVPRGSMIVFDAGRGEVRVTTSGPGQALLIGGTPFEEELVMWWNFVGRSHDEIVQAREDWEAGRGFGEVHGYAGDRLAAPPMPGTRLRPRPRMRFT